MKNENERKMETGNEKKKQAETDKGIEDRKVEKQRQAMKEVITGWVYSDRE